MRGHVYKRGNSYTIVVELNRDEDGKRRQKSVGGFKTKKEADKALNELILKVEKGEYFVSEDMLFKDYLYKWLLEYCSNNLAPKTIKTYKQLIDSYIVPRLGSIKLDKLKPLDLQSLYNYIQNELNLSRTTTLRVHEVINSSLKQAVEWQMLNKNVALSVKRPKKLKTEMNVLNAEQTNNLLERISHLTLYLPVLISATTGMRRGEVLGLTWDNVNLEEGVVYIEKQLQKIDDIYKFTPLKTPKSRRKIVLLDFTIPILKAEKDKQSELGLLVGSEHKKWNLVCCQITGTPYDADYLSRNFLRQMNKICPELDIPKIRFHDLRHTHATLLLTAGVNPKVVSERLGHSSISITLDVYSHVLPSMQEAAATKLNSLMLSSSKINP